MHIKPNCLPAVNERCIMLHESSKYIDQVLDIDNEAGECEVFLL